jgi:hypothetical protein
MIVMTNNNEKKKWFKENKKELRYAFKTANYPDWTMYLWSQWQKHKEQKGVNNGKEKR